MKRRIFVVFVAALFGACSVEATQPGNLLYLQTKPDTAIDLLKLKSGSDFRVCWEPIETVQQTCPVYLVFFWTSGHSAWSYLGYEDCDTCLVHYGAALFYDDIVYEVHPYFGSLRALPEFPRDPQDPRFPGEAFQDFW